MSSKSSGSSSSGWGDILAGLGSKMFRESDPTRQLLFGQMNEALKTGGVGAQIPLIQSAVTQSQSATAGSMASARDALAAAGLGKDPISQGILASIGMSGNQATSQIPTNLAQEFIGMAPGMTTNTTSSAISAMGTGAQLNTSFRQSSSDWGSMLSQMFGSLMGGGGQAGGLSSLFMG